MGDLDNVIGLQEIYDKRQLCLKCLKLRVDRKSEKLDCTCIAFSEFCFKWEKNLDKNPWDVKCFGFCGKENDWLDTQDEIHKYIIDKKIRDGYNQTEARSYVSVITGVYNKNKKLDSKELVGLKQLYYEETHPHLSGPPKNESTGRSKTTIAKPYLLDNDGGQESWRNVGACGKGEGMKIYDVIENNKRIKREEAKKNGTEDKSKDLKGVRRVANGGKGKESKTTEVKVVKEKKLKKG